MAKSLAEAFIKNIPLHPPTVWWEGLSGYPYITSVYPLFEPPAFSSAVYILVRKESSGYRPLYIGQTSNLTRRLKEHRYEKAKIALALGANELHVHLLANKERDRFSTETDLVRRWTPILNL
jgi:predicted GIY-YIG superfamily endonuclease